MFNVLTSVGVLVIALIVLVLGRPVENVEVLYYDADFEALYETDDEDAEVAPEQGKPIVARQTKPVPETKKVETTASEVQLDPASIAQDIYDSTTL